MRLLINEKRTLIVILSVLILGFLLLTYIVVKYPPSAIDLKVSSEIQKNHTPSTDQFMIFISWFGYTPVSASMALAVSALFYVFKYKRESVFTILTLTSGLVSSVIKFLVNRPRPTRNLVRIIEMTKEQSFPSGHTLFYTIFFGFMILVMLNIKSILRPVRIGVIVLSAWMILLIPFSRIYLGAHWVTDVTGGLILGAVCLIVLGHFYLSGKPSYAEKL